MFNAFLAILGTKPCKNYQKQLKDKAKEKCFFKFLEKTQVNFSFIPLVLESDSVGKTPQCKINLKSKKMQKATAQEAESLHS